MVLTLDLPVLIQRPNVYEARRQACHHYFCIIHQSFLWVKVSHEGAHGAGLQFENGFKHTGY